MSEAAAVIENNLANDIGASFSGVARSTQSPAFDPIVFEFDASFQTKVAAMVVRDSIFNEQTHGLIKPEYFENSSEATLVGIALNYFDKYRRIPDDSIFVKLMKEAIASKVIRSDMKGDVIAKFKSIRQEDIGDRAYVVEEIDKFARHQATERAILKSVELLQKGEFGKIEDLIKRALSVGTQEAEEYDFFDEIESRTEERLEMLAGNLAPQGITTGIAQIDKLLYHEGWGRKELSVLMGGAKAGKTVGLINSSISACMAGYNVLHVTLEVAKEIVASRGDANLSDLAMKELRLQPHKVRDAIRQLKAEGKVGEFKLHEFPSGTWKPSGLQRLIQHYKAKGLIFDLVVIDYLDIMAPDIRSDDSRENSRNIWIDCRAIAQSEGWALLSATQTNRDGFKAAVAKAEHAADDFNKIRTADLVISINKTDEEARRGEARLHFAASRNQQSGFSVHIKQCIEKMKFVTGVLSVE